MSGVIVEVSARKVSVPFECPCCGNDQPDGEFSATYTRTTGKRVIRSTTRGFGFPCCTRCLAHVEMWQSADAITMGFVIGGIVVVAIVGIAAVGVAGIAVFGLALVVGLVLASKQREQAKASCGPSCATPSTSISYLGWSGSVSSFRFASAIYAGRFAQRNSRNLINVNAELRRVLEHPALATPPVAASLRAPAPIPVPTAPRNEAAPTSGDPVLDWIARIEGYKGPVARRNALERALQEIHDPDAKRRLVLAAGRIEVAAVLDKVDSLASAAAKKRHLQKAIADIRADNIPGELQAAELQQLDERLRCLGWLMTAAMPMSPDKIREFAAHGEHSRLDFKREMYDWAKPLANSELAKDLMDMGNELAVDTDPGYILVGVDDDGTIVGIAPEKQHDDGDLHQRVKRLLNETPLFSYSVVDVDGLMVGVFEVRPGRRPYFPLKGSGNVLQRRVPLHRNGTSTDVASPLVVVEWSRQDDPEWLRTLKSNVPMFA